MDFEAFTKNEVTIIKQTCFPEGATDEDKTSCLLVANSLNLNPLMKEITFIERKACIEKNGKKEWMTKIEPMVGRDGYLTIAHRTGVYGLRSLWTAKGVGWIMSWLSASSTFLGDRKPYEAYNGLGIQIWEKDDKMTESLRLISV